MLAPFLSSTWQMLARCSVHAQWSAFRPSDTLALMSILLAMPPRIASTLSYMATFTLTFYIPKHPP